jgi:hypothetical protein
VAVAVAVLGGGRGAGELCGQVGVGEGRERLREGQNTEHCWVLSRAAERAAENRWLLPDALERSVRFIIYRTAAT